MSVTRCTGYIYLLVRLDWSVYLSKYTASHRRICNLNIDLHVNLKYNQGQRLAQGTGQIYEGVDLDDDCECKWGKIMNVDCSQGNTMIMDWNQGNTMSIDWNQVNIVNMDCNQDNIVDMDWNQNNMSEDWSQENK